jgi:hypothetical protein
MKIIGKNQSGIIVQIDYKELSELNGGVTFGEERLFRDVWDNIMKYYRKFIDFKHKVVDLKALLASVEGIARAEDY